MKTNIKFCHSLVVLMLLELALTGRLQAASVTVVLPQLKASASGEIKVPVQTRSAEGLGPLQLDLLFDAQQLKFVAAAEGSAGIGLFDFNLLEPGRLRLVMTGDPNKPIEGDAELFAVTFRANDSASGTVPLKVENVRAWEQTVEAYEMRVAVEPGSIDIKAQSRFPLLIVAGIAVVAVVLLLVVTHRFKGTPHVMANSPGHTSASAASQSHFCSNCGASLPLAGKFCSACGKPVSG